MPKVKSKTKDHFDKIDETKVKCKICSKILKTGGGTTNMLSHLTRHHPQSLVNQPVTANINESQDTRSDSASSSSTKHGPGTSSGLLHQTLLKVKSLPKNTKKIDEKLALMLATDFQPFSMLEDTGFVNFVKELNPNYKIPDKRKIRYELIPKLYRDICAKLKLILDETDYLSLTTDLWSSRNLDSFLTITAHFYYNGYLRSCVLNTVTMPESHTSENIAERIREVLSNWNVNQKVVCVLTDNAPNMIKMCRLLELRHMPCFAHTLNLLVQDALDFPNIQEVLTKCRNIVRYFKKSTVGSNTLMQEQVQKNQEKIPLKLLQDVSTRWNSTFYMVQRLIDLADCLAVVQRKLPQAPDSLSLSEENCLKDAVALLNLFEQATKMVSGDRYPTSALIIPIIHGLYENLRELHADIKTEVGLMLYDKLISYMGSRLIEYERRTVCRIATYLHPQLKDSFRQLENKQAAKDAIKMELNNLLRIQKSNQIDEIGDRESEIVPIEPIPPTISKPGPSLLNFLKKKETPASPSIEASSITILKMYNETPVPNLDEINTIGDPKNEEIISKYWDDNKHLTPLDNIAKKFLSVPATSVTSERVFSATGYILNDRRNSLKADVVEMLCFLNQNQWLYE